MDSSSDDLSIIQIPRRRYRANISESEIESASDSDSSKSTSPSRRENSSVFDSARDSISEDESQNESAALSQSNLPQLELESSRKYLTDDESESECDVSESLVLDQSHLIASPIRERIATPECNESVCEIAESPDLEKQISSGSPIKTPVSYPGGKYHIEAESSSESIICSSINNSPVTKASPTIQSISDEDSYASQDKTPKPAPTNDPEIFNISDEKPTASVRTNLNQPKITTLLGNASKSKKATKIKRVSQEYYNKKVNELENLKLEYTNAKVILEKLGKSLHDGGKQLELRVERLEERLTLMIEEVDALVVEEKAKSPAVLGPVQTHSWDDISAEVNKIMPGHTGRQGLNTFNKQKALTIDRLKDLHGSLETCPTTEQLAEDPSGLKVTLMSHQKQALVWLCWRESQKPRGGILADDMGLGKTLTMISLILKSKYEDNDEERENSDSSDDEPISSKKNRKSPCKGGTLIVCPASVLSQWDCEIENKVNRQKLSVCVHHGNKRDTKARYLASYDVVVTTYNIVSREAQTQGALFQVKWKRIILDEAHVIRNHKSKSSVAACELKAKYRWAITGTPIQNKEMDLYALLKFLKCSPFDDLSNWKKWIDNKSASGQQRLNTLIKSLLLRRTKVQLQEDGNLNCLPEWKFETFDVELDKEEMNVYQTMLSFSKSLFAQYLLQRQERQGGYVGISHSTSSHKEPNNKALNHIYQKFCGNREVKSYEILVLLLRLRQICCHTGLIYEVLEDDENLANAIAVEPDPNVNMVDLFQQLTISDTIEKLSLSADEDVFAKATERILQKSNPVFQLTRYSSKMRKALEVIEKHIVNTSDKCIVVSQWVASLNIFKRYLDEKNIVSLSLNGAVPVPERQKIISNFNNPTTKPKVLLLSLTAGGVGLNLTGANHLLFLDPHWNPQLELQARDRIYRVGQKKPVFIYKFVCKHTVEERIFALQNHKLDIAQGVLMGMKAADGGKLSIDDLKSLFEM